MPPTRVPKPRASRAQARISPPLDGPRPEQLRPMADGAPPEVVLYCDGACAPNPGWGGWGVVLLAPGHGHRRELSGSAPETTNNRMELTAALEGVRSLRRPSRLRIVTDSQYLRNAFTQGWIAGWQRNGWRTSSREPVKNEDLWRALIEALRPHTVEWAWVRGHADNPENNRCDELAVAARIALADGCR